jgi:hypothetical protein
MMQSMWLLFVLREAPKREIVITAWKPAGAFPERSNEKVETGYSKLRCEKVMSMSCHP